jgi:hypothetical protein
MGWDGKKGRRIYLAEHGLVYFTHVGGKEQMSNIP